VPGGRGGDQRNGLHDVGADQLGRRQPGIGDQQQRDDQRTGTDRGHADREAAEQHDQHGPDRSHHQRAGRPLGTAVDQRTGQRRSQRE